MSSSAVEITTPDGVAGAYLARPDDGPHPGVLLIMDAFGLRPAIDQMADRIAADGYVVLAPNVFYRAGRLRVPDLSDSEARASFFQSIRPLMDELVPERVASDGGAYLDCLADLAQPGPVGITGYCMGGRIAWRIAAPHPDRIATLERTLDDLGSRYRADVYEGAQHGYTMADTPTFDEGARERHFSELHAL